ncbi:MAG: hypothetical protein MRY83_23195 [Flavobacteriales bacterium]|nr:hypothetical protein [Flavobacteriales bacterium]
MKKAFVFACLLVLNFQVICQTNFDPNLIEHSYQLLSYPKEEISQNDLLNEMILDEVKVQIQDSLLKKKTERYQFFGAEILPVFGGNWRAVRMDKRKYVGTVKRSYNKLAKDRFTELDVNFDIYSNINRYREIAHLGYVKQKEIGRKPKKYDYSAEPFVNPKEPEDVSKYTLHCELTVPESHRAKVNGTFYPCIRGNSLKTHKNFYDMNPSFGMYGPIAVDCYHACWPEMHPYEWIWWYDLTDKKSIDQTWYLGLFVEGSKRFPNWAGKQKTGTISIPFSFEKDQELYKIKIKHLVIGELDRKQLVESGFIDPGFMTFGDVQNYFDVPISDEESISFLVESDIPFNYGGLVFKISDLEYKDSDQLIEGRFEIALSTTSAYCAQVSFIQ